MTENYLNSNKLSSRLAAIKGNQNVTIVSASIVLNDGTTINNLVNANGSLIKNDSIVNDCYRFYELVTTKTINDPLLTTVNSKIKEHNIPIESIRDIIISYNQAKIISQLSE